MRWGHSPILAALALLIFIAPEISRAAEIGWPEVVGRLAGEKTKAETCAEVLKGNGDIEQISQGQLAYGEAKANFDGVIAGLVAALTEGGNPKSLPSLETDLEHGAEGLGKFCKTVSDLLPKSSGRKGALTDIAKGAVEPLIKALSEGVATLYNTIEKTTLSLVRQSRPSWRPRNGPVLPRSKPPNNAFANFIAGAANDDFAGPLQHRHPLKRGCGGCGFVTINPGSIIGRASLACFFSFFSGLPKAPAARAACRSVSLTIETIKT